MREIDASGGDKTELDVDDWSEAWDDDDDEPNENASKDAVDISSTLETDTRQRRECTDFAPLDVACLVYLKFRISPPLPQQIDSLGLTLPSVAPLVLCLLRSTEMFQLGLELVTVLTELSPRHSFCAVISDKTSPLWILFQQLTTIFSQLGDKDYRDSLRATIVAYLDVFIDEDRFQLLADTLALCPFPVVVDFMLAQLKKEVSQSWPKDASLKPASGRAKAEEQSNIQRERSPFISQRTLDVVLAVLLKSKDDLPERHTRICSF